ncbi:MAG TPA: lytic transglycosylase domain-containing protein, partial [Acidimicrobiales bacterium]
MRRTAVHRLWQLARWTPVLGAVVALAAMPGSIAGSTLPIVDHDDGPDLEPGQYPGLDRRDDLGLEPVTVRPETVSRPVGQVIWTTSTQEEVESAEQVVRRLGTSGIPEVALRAYTRAQETMAVTDPGCGISWSLLAAIGRVESNHGRYGGAELRADGYGTRKIRGIPLDGRPGIALIRDTDDGTLDGDPVYDRAVGPMQFIPTSWWAVAADGNGDGRRDPDNIFDAALGSATYLCAGDADLRDRAQRAQAVFRYNHSQDYVDTVMALADAYERGQASRLPHEEPVAQRPPVLPKPPETPANHGPPPG